MIFLKLKLSDSRDTQRPRYGKIKDARLNNGDLVFALPPKAPSKPPDPAPQVADCCAIAWDSIKNADSEQLIESFLAGCKDSLQAFAANLRLNDLRSRCCPDPPANSIPAVLTPVIWLPRGMPATALRSAPIITSK